MTFRSDTMDKIVFSYFAAVTKERIEYKGKIIEPKPLRISPLLLRSFKCEARCAGCCSVFTRDYLLKDVPSRVHYESNRRHILLNGGIYDIFTEPYDRIGQSKCIHVEHETGFCKVHGEHPFSCDFELIRAVIFKHPNQPNVLTSKLYGRGWNMMRVDGERGALCTMGLITPASINEVSRKIRRLQSWCEHFELDNWCPDILEWIQGEFKSERIFGMPKGRGQLI